MALESKIVEMVKWLDESQTATKEEYGDRQKEIGRDSRCSYEYLTNRNVVPVSLR